MNNTSAIETTDDNGLRLERLSKNFGEFIAVEDVKLHVSRGEFLTILGPSGSGKTTLLMIIAGFLEATKGDMNLFRKVFRKILHLSKRFMHNLVNLFQKMLLLLPVPRAYQ